MCEYMYTREIQIESWEETVEKIGGLGLRERVPDD